MLLIDNRVVEQVLSMRDCIAAQETAFAELLTGGALARPRLDMYVPCDRPDGYYRFGSVEGTSGGILAVRLKSDVLVWPPNGSEQKYCIEPGTYCGLVFLFSTGNGEPLAILNDGHLQHMRVGGAGGLGTRLLAREDSHELAIIGSGGMAHTFFDAITAVRPIRRVRVYSRTPANAERFAQAMAAKSGLEVVAMGSAREAMRGADIVATCTDSTRPTFEADWLEKGQHVLALAPRELSSEIVARFDLTVQQGREVMPMPESERFRKGISGSPGAYVAGTVAEQERLPKAKQARIRTEDWPTYTDVISGQAPARTSDDQISFYYTVGNWGVQFSAVGGLVWRLAKERGLGVELPLSWFVQDVRN